MQPEIVVMRDGSEVILRVVTPADDRQLEQLFYRCSRQTIAQWLGIGAPHQPYWAATLARWAEGADRDCYVVAALAGDQIVGTGRFDRQAASHEAELALIVEDRWQGLGLGRTLLLHLVGEACRRQVTIATALVHADNRRVIRLVSFVFPHRTAHWTNGEYHVRACLAAFPSCRESASSAGVA